MHAVAAFFASIITFVSGFFAPTVASNSPANVRATQPAAVVAAQTDIVGNPFNDPDAASAVTPAIPAAAPAPVFSPQPAQTVINQPVIERIIERIVPQGGTISAETLAAILADFEQSISNRLAALNPPPAAIPAQVAAGGNSGSYAFSPASQRIDQLTNTAINTPTITGGTISGANVSGYLPLAGGTLIGTLSGTDLTLSGALSAGALNVASIASAGALTGPYVTATSTTATSSFAGGFTGPGNFTVQSSSGWVGIGTTSPTAKLHVDDNSYGYQLIINNSAVSGNSVMAFTQSASNKAAIGIAGASNGLIAGAAAGDLVMRSNTGTNSILFSANAGSSAHMAITSAGSIGIGTTTPWGKLSITGSGTGTGLAFAVADSANTPRFVIQDNGNVGIGTTTPATALQVQTALPGIQIGNGASNSGAFLNFAGALTAKNWRIANRWQVSDGLEFTPSTANGETTFNTPAVVFKDSGNVGIGTTSPTNKLEVAGNTFLGGTITGTSTLALTGTTGTTTIASGQGFNIGSSQFVVQQGSGNVGIGTTGPSAKLHVVGSEILDTQGTGGALNIYAYGNLVGNLRTPYSGTAYDQLLINAASGGNIGFGINQNEKVRIDSSGNLGIGTTSPAAKLEVSSSGSGNPVSFYMDGDRGLLNAQAGNIGFRNKSTNIASIDGYTGATGGSINYGQLVFSTANSGSLIERMRITESGNVGIGTTTPSAKLEVADGAGNSIQSTGKHLRHRYGSDPADTYRFFLTSNTLGDFGMGIGNEAGLLLRSGDGTQRSVIASQENDLAFFTGGSTNANATERLRITSSGNVGIGTTSPAVKLHVEGGSLWLANGSGGGIGGAGKGLRAFYDLSNDRAEVFTYDYNGNVAKNLVLQSPGGNVGIGTTTPWGKLSITGSGTGTGLAFAVADSANTPRFVIQDNGNVGIGNIGPGVELDIGNSSEASDADLRLFTASTYNSKIRFREASDAFGFTLQYAGAGDRFGIIRNDNDATGVEALSILRTSGNVGIGTTSPTNKLEVAGNAFFGGTITGTSTLALTGTSGTTTIAAGQGFTIGGSQFVVQQGSGNVGIGTTSPYAQLSVLNASQNTYFTVDTAVNNANIRFGGTANTAATFVRSSSAGFNLLNFYTGATSDGSVGMNSGSSVLSLFANANNSLQISSGAGGSGGATLFMSTSSGASTYLKVPRPAGGAGAQYGFVALDVDDGTGYPNQSSHFTFNTVNTTPNTNAVFVVDRGSNFSNTRPSALFANKVGIGATSTAPTTMLDVWGSAYVQTSLGIGTTTPSGILEVGNTSASGIVSNFTNGNSAATAYAELGVRNGYTAANNADALRLLTFGTGWTTTGGYVQDGAALEAGVNLSGGLSMVARNSAGVLRFYTGGQADSNERMRITSTGNVGIGTTNPVFGKLSVAGSDDSTLDSAMWGNSVGAGVVSGVQNSSTVVGSTAGIRLITRSTGAKVWNIYNVSTGAGSGDLAFGGGASGTGSEVMRLGNSGNVGIGTTTPTAQLSTTGTVRFASLGSGGANLVTDALGNVTASSDERLKDKQGEFTRGLAAINAISPVLYKWRPETGFDTQSTYAGFFAQNVQTAIPEAVSPDSRGYLTLADRPILAALVNATKEIGTITGAFKDSLIAWLGSASNGIGDLFAKDIYATNGTFDTTTANTTNTRELCITDGVNDNAPLCLTKSQLAALLGQTASFVAPSSVIPGTAPNAPESVISQVPIIELNGNASSTIELGDTYNDLGARIVAPESDLNLGIVVLLDGATTTAISIDTSTPGEHTILYTVTSPTTGLTGRAMRTVIVSPAELSPAPAEDTNPFNAPPSNDNASSTTAVDAAA